MKHTYRDCTRLIGRRYACLKGHLKINQQRTFFRIYSINRPGRLLNFWTLRVGAYSRWAFIRGWALIKFSPFSESEVCLFCNKTINANDKTRRSNKAGFCKILWRKLRPLGSLLLECLHSSGWGGGERLFWVWLRRGGVGAYSRLGAY